MPRDIIQGKGLDTSYMQRTPGESAFGALASLISGFSEKRKFEMAENIRKDQEKTTQKRWEEEMDYKRDLAQMQFSGQMNEKDWAKMEGEMALRIYESAAGTITPAQAAAHAKAQVNAQRGISQEYKYIKDSKGQILQVPAASADSLLATSPGSSEVTRAEWEKTELGGGKGKGATGRTFDKALAVLANIGGSNVTEEEIATSGIGRRGVGVGPGAIGVPGPSFQAMAQAMTQRGQQQYPPQPPQQATSRIPYSAGGINLAGLL